MRRYRVHSPLRAHRRLYKPGDVIVLSDELAKGLLERKRVSRLPGRDELVSPKPEVPKVGPELAAGSPQSSVATQSGSDAGVAKQLPGDADDTQGVEVDVKVGPEPEASVGDVAVDLKVGDDDPTFVPKLKPLKSTRKKP